MNRALADVRRFARDHDHGELHRAPGPAPVGRLRLSCDRCHETREVDMPEFSADGRLILDPERWTVEAMLSNPGEVAFW